MADTTPIFFFGRNSKYGPFSQWYPAKFTVSRAEINSVVGLPLEGLAQPDEQVQFQTAEQFMMYCKALRFHDEATAASILRTAVPAEQKQLGRRVRGFTDAGWDAVKSQVVELANVAKFSQNDQLRDTLLRTGEREIVEASPYDRIWGIGLDAQTGRATMDTREGWGQNLLGKALVSARAQIRRYQRLTE